LPRAIDHRRSSDSSVVTFIGKTARRWACVFTGQRVCCGEFETTIVRRLAYLRCRSPLKEVKFGNGCGHGCCVRPNNAVRSYMVGGNGSHFALRNTKGDRRTFSPKSDTDGRSLPKTKGFSVWPGRCMPLKPRRHDFRVLFRLSVTGAVVTAVSD